MTYTFGVITRTPEGAGNLACSPIYREIAPPDRGNDYRGVYEADAVLTLSCRLPVFTLGEILILNEDGREVAGHGRKPAKWDVGCEHFDTIGAAVLRAQEVQA